MQTSGEADQRDARGEAVIWSKLSSVQRAYLACGARYTQDGKPTTARAEAIKSLKERQKDADAQRDAMNKCWQIAAMAGFSGQVKKLPAGKARGADYLQKKTARALPMTSWK
jgi:hypothetical protein